jgi:hypothetical protein
MYLGINEDPVTPEAAQPDTDAAWWRRPVDSVLELVGNITYRTDDYSIQTRDGSLVVDRSSTPGTNTDAPAAVTTGAGALQRIPPVVWIAGAAVLGLMLIRR